MLFADGLSITYNNNQNNNNSIYKALKALFS